MNTFCEAIRRQGDYKKGIQAAEQAAEIFRSFDDAAGEARSCWTVSYIHSTEGNTLEAQRNAERALELYRRAGDLEGQGNAYNIMAIANPDFAKARIFYEHSMAAFALVGNLERTIHDDREQPGNFVCIPGAL